MQVAYACIHLSEYTRCARDRQTRGRRLDALAFSLGSRDCEHSSVWCSLPYRPGRARVSRAASLTITSLLQPHTSWNNYGLGCILRCSGRREMLCVHVCYGNYAECLFQIRCCILAEDYTDDKERDRIVFGKLNRKGKKAFSIQWAWSHEIQLVCAWISGKK